jgi:hypothetical protein
MAGKCPVSPLVGAGAASSLCWTVHLRTYHAKKKDAKSNLSEKCYILQIEMHNSRFSLECVFRGFTTGLRTCHRRLFTTNKEGKKGEKEWPARAP